MELITKYPFVSVIVVVLNMAEYIGTCLSSLVSLDYPKDRYEIIVVDGGSTDGTLETCLNFNVDCYVYDRRGRGLARNFGIKKAKGEIVVFIDADCKAYKNWLLIHVASHKDQKIGATVGSIIDPYLDISTNSSIVLHYVNFAEFDEDLPRNYMYHAPTCNTSFKMSALQTVHFFDEDLDLYEDFLLSRKITDAGYKILFEPQAKIHHLGIKSNIRFYSYLKRERKTGEGHFKAQSVNKYMFGRLPMQPILLLFFSPSIIIARIVREFYKVIRIKNFRRRAIVLIPYLIGGGLMWSYGYFTKAIEKEVMLKLKF